MKTLIWNGYKIFGWLFRSFNYPAFILVLIASLSDPSGLIVLPTRPGDEWLPKKSRRKGKPQCPKSP